MGNKMETSYELEGGQLTLSRNLRKLDKPKEIYHHEPPPQVKKKVKSRFYYVKNNCPKVKLEKKLVIFE